MNRQRSDVPAWKEQGLYDERIRREREPRSADFEDGLIVHAVEQRVREQGQKHIAQQLGAEPAATAVAQKNTVLRTLMGVGQMNEAISSSNVHLGMLRMPPVLVIGGAGALSRNHRRSQRLHRRATRSKGRTIHRLL